MPKNQVQTDLFKRFSFEEDGNIPGLDYIPDYITSSQESELVDFIDSQNWISELKRRVQHYGYKYDYKARSITNDLRIGEVPDLLKRYCVELYENGFFTEIPDQVIVNEYQPGQGISPHVDCVPCFTGEIASISLLSHCVMDFEDIHTNNKTPVLLQPCSLVVLSGRARYDSKHGIAARKSDRYKGNIYYRTRRLSVTFRKVIV